MLRNHATPITTPESEASKSLIAKGKQYYTENYRPREMILDHGKGSRVWDLDGNDYIDLGSGIAVNSLGHQDPDLIAALTEQAHKIWHTSNIFFTAPPILLAEALVEAVPFAKRVYLCNSGAEANEATIKLIRKWAASTGRAPDHREIITFTGSFHGRTLATVTATAQPKYHEGFEPMPGGFVYCDPFNDIEALKKLITEKTCAIMLEPLQGEGGIIPAAPGYLKALRKICDEKGILLVFDEIQCGMGRTGKLFCYMHEEGLEPDILTSAKALGCGIPIGAMLVGEKVEHIFQFGSHGSTFGGNPVMCSVALAALKKINTKEIMENTELRATELRAQLAMINQELAVFSDIRGQGLMIGAELKGEWKGKANDISDLIRRFGVLVLVAGPNVLRFLPPLNITEEELHIAMLRLHEGLRYAQEHFKA